jgi:SAM-dependent MidA family methyltransferase
MRRRDNIALEIAPGVVRFGGAALMVDYGHAESAIGDTLQAVGRHDVAEPLRTPGEVDLTAHVDFQALAQAAEGMGARVHGPVPQSVLLRALGIESERPRSKRARRRLCRRRSKAALERLTDENRTGMGPPVQGRSSVSDPKLDALPGFDGSERSAGPPLACRMTLSQP